eukprot:TRINITY_DN17187_c0_g1_i1.p1 TRINITY_DN17187_c0_g1~~TRINITY_DN17187_c0_g1_i1.p1  ORF type:complete len:268 (+),score=16.24 TRINITY_DN17187_c0_g1_i1:53-856(+)
MGRSKKKKAQDAEEEVLFEQLRLRTRELKWERANRELVKRKWAAVPPLGDEKAVCCVVLLHGLGGHGTDMIALGRRLAGNLGDRCRIVCPTARTRVNYGDKAPAWFVYKTDMSGEDEVDDIDIDTLRDSRESLWELLDQEIKDLPDEDPKRMLLVGYSQGASMAVDCVFHPRGPSIAGAVALRGIAMPQSMCRADDCSALNVPVLIVAGADDDTYLPSVSSRCVEQLRGVAGDVRYSLLEGLEHGGHSEAEDRLVVDFARERLRSFL